MATLEETLSAIPNKEEEFEGLLATIPELKVPEREEKLRIAPEPTMWQNFKGLFDDFEIEEAKAVQSIIDSQTLGISPSTAYKYQKQIAEGKKIHPMASKLDSTLTERIMQRWDTGVAHTQIGHLRAKQVLGDNSQTLENNIQNIKTSIPTESERYIAEYGLLEDFLGATAEMLPIMVHGIEKGAKRGLVLGMGAASITAIAGQVPPLTAIPEEVVTVPGAFLGMFGVGMVSGTLENIGLIEAGLAYDELLEFEDEEGNKLNPKIAKGIAGGVGIINGLIELAQIKLLLKTIPGGQQLLRTSINKATKEILKDRTLQNLASKYIKKYTGFIALETGQEVAQETTNILANRTAIYLNNELMDTDIPQTTREEIIDRLLKTASESAKAFVLMGLPGITTTAAIEVRDVKKIDKIKKATEKLYRQFENAKASQLVMGATELEAEAKALDTIVETPEGKRFFDISVTERELTKEEEEKAVGEFKEEVEIEEIISDENFEAIIAGEKTLEEIFPIEEIKPLVEPIIEPTKRIITEETYKKAQQRFNEKMKGIKVGVDPTAIAELVTIGAYHIETGIRTFAEWSKVMVDKYGEKIRPHLREIWKQANAYLEQKAPKAVKKKVRLTTGQVQINKLIREDIVLKSAMKKAEQNARIAYRVGTKEAKARAKADFKDILFKAKIIAQAKGIKEGTRITRKELIEHFRDSQKEIRQTQKLLREYIEENLPSQLRGKFLNAITQNLTTKRLVSIYGRTNRLADELIQKERITEVEKLKGYKGNIPVEYQKQIGEILNEIETKKFSPKTIKKLEGLRDYMEREGIPSGISPKLLADLKIFEKKNVKEMTSVELQEITDIIKHLIELGELKQKLKYKYNERIRKAAIAKLVASTRNIDSVDNVLAKGVWWSYLQTLQTPRVADIIDGYKSYSGENAKLIKQLVKKETMSLLETKTLVDTALEEVIDIGLKTLTEEQQIKIMINIRNQEEAFDQVQTLMDKYDYTEIPELTGQENQVIEILKKYTTQHTDEIAAIYEEIYNKPFAKIEKYILPIKYEREFDYDTDPSELIIQSRYRATQTFKGFVYERQKGVKKIPRVDVMGVFEEAINQQEWFINMQPELENIKYLVKSKEYTKSAGKFASDWWKDQLDIVARRGWSASVKSNNFSNLLRVARFNLNQAILGYKASSILMQPFAVFDAMAYAQSKWGSTAAAEVFKEFSNAWINPKYAKEFIDVSPALQVRKAGEVAIAETLERIGRTQGKWAKFVRGGLSLLQKADVRTAAGVEKGLLNVLEKHGVENAKEEADFLMMLVSSSAEVTFRPHVLARGQFARTVFTFQTFFLNRWGLIAHDIIATGLIKSTTWKAKYSALVALAIYSAGGIVEDEAREFIYEMTTRRELPDVSPFMTALMAIPKNIPLLGRLIEVAIIGKGVGGDIPLERVVENLIRGIVAPVSSTESKAMAKRIMKGIEAGLTLRGVPGTAQFFDVLEGILFPEKKKKKK